MSLAENWCRVQSFNFCQSLIRPVVDSQMLSLQIFYCSWHHDILDWVEPRGYCLPVKGFNWWCWTTVQMNHTKISIYFSLVLLWNHGLNNYFRHKLLFWCIKKFSHKFVFPFWHFVGGVVLCNTVTDSAATRLGLELTTSVGHFLNPPPHQTKAHNHACVCAHIHKHTGNPKGLGMREGYAPSARRIILTREKGCSLSMKVVLIQHFLQSHLFFLDYFLGV